MKILQISDFHLSAETSNIEKVKKMIEMIQKNINLKTINAIFLCGDLVNKHSLNLISAFQEIKKSLASDSIPILLTCGNHDIDRKKMKPMFINHVKSLDTNDKLNKFVELDESNQFTESIHHFFEYQELIKTEILPDILQPLYYIKKIKDGERLIGIVSVNSAWFSYGSSDEYGSIVFPITYIYDCIKAVNDCSIKIFMTHFPISYFTEFNRNELQGLVYSYFDIYLCGHTHRNENGINYYSDAGVFSCTSTSLTSLEGHLTNGFILHEFNWDEMTNTVSEQRYIDNKYIQIYSKNISLPIDDTKKDAIIINKAISEKHSRVCDLACKRFCMFDKEGSKFLDFFTDPVLKENERIKSFVSDAKNPKVSSDKIISLSKLLDDNNYAIYGGEKSGKTILLYWIYLEYLSKYLTNNMIPIYIDMKYYYKSIGEGFKKNISDWLREEYGLSSKYVEILLKKSNIVFVIDNYKIDNNAVNDLLLKIVANNKFIFSIETNLNPTVRSKIDDKVYKEVFIHDITRKQLRELTGKWPTITRSRQNEIINKIVTIFSQLNINCNFWTASLFLEVFEKSKSINIHNNIELIDLYVENMLDKEKLSLDLEKKFSYENYKDFLSELAYYFLSKCENNEYTAKYIEIVTVYEKFKIDNIRIIADSRTIIDYIITKGVIVDISADRYTFKLNGIFEYFLAHYMKRKNVFLESVLCSSDLFLSFKNELEIYSGLIRNDENTLIRVYVNTLNAYDKYFEVNPYYKLISTHQVDYKSSLMNALAHTASNAKPLALIEKDVLEDSLTPIDTIDSEVKLKYKYDIEKINTDLLYEHVYTLSRVFRSMDDIQDKEILKEILVFVLNCSMLLPYYIIEDIKKEKSNVNDPSNKILLKVLEEFSPVVSQMYLYNAIAHQNLEALINEVIVEYKSNTTKQDELFVLFFLIIEHDIVKSLPVLDAVIDACSSNKVLLTDIMIKIIIYIVMNCETDIFENELKSRVLRINKIVNPDDRSSKIIENINRSKITKEALEKDEC